MKLFQIGLLEKLSILILGLIIMGQKRWREVTKTIMKCNKKIENKSAERKNDMEEEMGAEELKKEVSNE
jgi:hypothetical protein